jgi:hypothetical protein
MATQVPVQNNAPDFLRNTKTQQTHPNRRQVGNECRNGGAYFGERNIPYGNICTEYDSAEQSDQQVFPGDLQVALDQTIRRQQYPGDKDAVKP